MTDLVKLLRDEHAELANSREDWLFLLEAADCIEELKAMIPVDYWELHLNLVDFQRKYDALVDAVKRVGSWNHVRALLEDDDG